MRHGGAALTLVLAMSLATASCDPVTPVAVPILVITATWFVDGQPDRAFTFDAVEDDTGGLEHGTFTGLEEDDNEPVDFPLTGFWANGEVEFTVQRPGGDVTYSASFSHDLPTQLTFHSASETIVLLQP